MGTNGSFYANGLPIGYTETGLGNVPQAPLAPKTAESSFYLSGSIYQTVQNQDALLALLTADTALVVADLVSANAAAANAQASAAAAIVTLSTSLKIANNLSDLGNLTTALTNIGLQNVTNTSDVNKPVSTAQATADALVASNAAAATALKANIASPALTGAPSAPTAAALTNTTQLATTAYADSAVSALSGTVTTALALKAPLASPAFTGTVVAPLITGGASAGSSLTVESTTNATPSGDRLNLYASRVVIGNPTNNSSIIDINGSTGGGVTVNIAGPGNGLNALNVYNAAGSLQSWVPGGGNTTINFPAATGTLALLASPALTGTPTAPTAAFGTNTTQLATTAFVLGLASGSTPAMNGTAASGVNAGYARDDHVHPTDTSRAALASPTFTGIPAAPTATVGTNTTQLATTAFVIANAASAGVASVGGQVGVLTVPGGSFGSTALSLLRYDAAQTLTSANKQQLQTNVFQSITTQTLTSGTAATYTTPTGVRWIEVYIVGGSGGGAGVSGTAFVVGSDGAASTFNSVNANPGKGGTANIVAPSALGGTGGTGTATRRINGEVGGPPTSNASISLPMGRGGNSWFTFGAAPSPGGGVNVGIAGTANTGGGGSGANNNSSSVNNGGGGGGGETAYLIINSPAATYTYTVGGGGAGGVSTTNGGAGGSGVIFVVEHYQ